MITERQEELAAQHAFGFLEDAELSEFKALMAENAELRALVEQLEETAALTALAAPQISPPAGLKMRLLTLAADRAPESKIVRFPILPFAPWAAAAALALAAIWLGGRNFALRAENTALRTDRQLAETAYKIAQNQLAERSLVAESMINNLGNKLRHSEDLARLKITALASLAGNTKEAQVIAVWDPALQTGLLAMEKLPAINSDQDYQIWIVDPAYKDPVNGGVFHVSENGRVALPFKPDQPVTQVTAFAISLERKGGVPKAEGPIVLLGK